MTTRATYVTRGRRARREVSLRSAQKFSQLTMLMPAIALMTALIAMPLVYSVATSLQARGTSFSDGNWVGLEHYISIISSAAFWNSLRVSTAFTIGSVLLVYIIGLVLALTLQFKTPLATIAQASGIVAWSMPYVAVGIMWSLIFDYQYGPLNWVLRDIGAVDGNIGWLLDPKLALATIVFVQVWKLFPLASVLLLAGLQGIPDERIEAARLDGASGLRLLQHILLPGVRSVSTILSLLLIMWIFGRSFTVIYVMTGGGPANATNTLVIRMFEHGFVDFDLQTASALGVIVLGICSIIMILYWRFTFKGMEAE